MEAEEITSLTSGGQVRPVREAASGRTDHQGRAWKYPSENGKKLLERIHEIARILQRVGLAADYTKMEESFDKAMAKAKAEKHAEIIATYEGKLSNKARDLASKNGYSLFFTIQHFQITDEGGLTTLYQAAINQIKVKDGEEPLLSIIGDICKYTPMLVAIGKEYARSGGCKNLGYVKDSLPPLPIQERIEIARIAIQKDQGINEGDIKYFLDTEEVPKQLKEIGPALPIVKPDQKRSFVDRFKRS